MDDIFGIPMTGIMLTLLVLLSFCLLAVAWVAWRRPVIFKLGVRNIPRRRAQSTLVVVGLMLSTLIISAALGTGDTIDHSVTVDVYDNLGPIDELVVASQDGEATADLTAEGTFDDAAFADVEAALAGDTSVDGLLPLLDARAAIVNDAKQLAEPGIILSGVDPTRLSAFGGLTGTDGEVIDVGALGADGVVVSASLAEDLNAEIGDRVSLYVNDAPVIRTVAAIAQDSYLGGTRRSRSSDLETSGVAMPLAALQELTGQPGRLSAIAISNAGGARDGLDGTDAVVAKLRAALSGQGLGVDPIKQDRIDTAESLSTVFTAAFLVLGLFSISAGVLLIVLIFTMLAAERRSEMGMERAVGAHRRQLVQQFVAEGSGYALLAGLVGAALGVGATFGIASGMKLIFGDYVPIEPYVAPRSLVVAYALGVLITFLTVVGASWKISRLNIVAAVRDIPDISTPKRKKMTLVWAGLLLLGGGLMTMAGAGGGSALPFMTGMSLLPFGVALALRFFGVPSRPVFTAVGLALLVFWLLPEAAFSAIFGDYESGFSLFFVSGIFLVIAATLVTLNNLDYLLAGVSRLGGVFRGSLPAVRTAIAYPGAARGRTGLTVAMFSLIVFSLVMMATMNQNFSRMLVGDEANAGWDVRADQFGAQPIADFEGALRAQGVDTGRFAAVGVTHSPSMSVSDARVVGDEDQAWKTYPVRGMEPGFIEGSELLFGQRARGYETDQAIIEALRTQSNVVIADALALPRDGDLGGNEDLLTLTGLSSGDAVFDPIPVELVNPADGSTHTVTVIGILDEQISSLQGLYAAQSTIDAVYGQTAASSYYVALNNPDEADQAAKEIEAALLAKGVEGTSIRGELEESQKQSTGFLYIIEGFMGLGLVVGIAAVGVIASRSVVERRQQIGVLRALGFPRGTVALSFLIETAFVVGLGGLAGTVLGLILARNLFTSDEVGSSDAGFVVPWVIIVTIALLTNAAALLMTWLPARQAARIAPAEALRYE